MIDADARATTSGGIFGGVGPFAMRGLTLLGKFGLIFFLVRFLPPSKLGIFGIFTASVQVGSQLLGLGFNIYSGRDLLGRPQPQWAALLRDQLLLHALTYCLALPLSLVPFWLKSMPWSLWPWFYPVLLLEHLSMEAHRVLVVAARPNRAAMLLLIRSGAWCYLAIAYYAVARPEGLVPIFLFWALGLIATLLLAGVFLSDFDWRATRSTRTNAPWLLAGLRTSLPFLAAGTAAPLTTAVERYLIQARWGNDWTGVYVFFAGIASAGYSVLEAGVISAHYQEVVTQGARPPKGFLRRFIFRILAFSLLVLLPATVAIFPVLRFAKTALYREGLPIYWVLLVNVVVMAACWIPDFALFSRKRDRALISASVGGPLLAIGLDFALVPAIGPIGAAVAAVAGNAARFLVNLRAMRRPAASAPEAVQLR